MSGRTAWTLLVVVVYGVQLTGVARIIESPGWQQTVYSATYFTLGVILLGAVARWWALGTSTLWRPVMLGLGALAAVLEIRLWPEAGSQAPVERWMLALVGLLAAAILVRLVPEPMKRAWLGLDRRQNN